MAPPSGKKPAPPPKQQGLSDVTDPHAQIDVLQTAQLQRGRPAPAPAEESKSAPAAGDRTLIYDASKGRARDTAGQNATLHITAGPRKGQQEELTAEETSIGRGEGNTIVLPDISVSRRHIVVRREGSGYVVLDQGSGNGTRVNGLVVGRHELQSGDQIDLGDSSLQFVEAGGVLVKGGKKAPAPVPAKAAALYEEPRPELTNPRAAGLSRRQPMYLAIAATLLLALAAGLYRKHVREREAEAAQSDGSRAVARRNFADAAELVKAGKWIEARDKLQIAASLDGDDEEIARYLERAKAEAPRAEAVLSAQASLGRRDFAQAQKALEGVPDDSALADRAAELKTSLRQAMDTAVRDAKARAEAGDASAAEALLQPVLEADPSRRDAQEVREGLGSSRRRSATPAVRRERAPRDESATAAARPGADDPDTAGIVATYLGGDLGPALTRAESLGVTSGKAARLARELREFDAAYREGLAREQQKKPAEALRALQAADDADRQIAHGKESKPGREVRRALGRVHYQIGAASLQEDEGLPQAALHLRAASAADPDNELARQQLRQVQARAKEIYLRAYVAKDTDAPAARKAFQLVADTLAPSDETAQKARRWLAKLDGRTAGSSEDAAKGGEEE